MNIAKDPLENLKEKAILYYEKGGSVAPLLSAAVRYAISVKREAERAP